MNREVNRLVSAASASIAVAATAAAMLAALACTAGPVQAQTAVDPVTYRATATVVSVVRKEFPDVELVLGDLIWTVGPAGAPQRLTGLVSFSGPLDLSRWETRARLGAWYLIGGDRIDCGLKRDRMTGRYYIDWLSRQAAIKTPEAPRSALKLTLEIKPNPAKAGGEVEFDFTVANVSAKAVTHQISSGRQFDIIVSKGSQVVWRWSHNRFFTMALQSVTIEPGKSKGYTATWNMVDLDGKKVAPGQYLAMAVYTISGKEPPATEPVELVVKQ